MYVLVSETRKCKIFIQNGVDVAQTLFWCGSPTVHTLYCMYNVTECRKEGSDARSSYDALVV